MENKTPGNAGRMVNTVSHQLKRHMSMHKVEDGLTHMQRRVLHFILFESLKNPIYQKDIEKEFQIRRSTATGILQLLERDGFLYREADKSDGRLKKVVPTDKAKALRSQILEEICYVEQVLHRGISEEDMAVCIRVLEKMSENLLGDEERKRGENEL